MKSKKANMVAITMLIVLILAGGAIVASVKFQDNRKADRTNVQEHELELGEMVRAGYDDANFIMNGVYYNHPTAVDGDTCLWYRNRPTPPNTDQFLEQLQTQIQDYVTNNFATYSQNLPVEISLGNIQIQYNPASYELPEDYFDIELFDLIINSDEGEFPVFEEDESGSFIVDTTIGNIYNSIISWIKTDAGNVMPKIQAKLTDSQCYYHGCPCEYDEVPDIEAEAIAFQEEENIITSQKIKEAIEEAAAELSIENHDCVSKSNIKITDHKRYQEVFGACPQKTPVETSKHSPGYKVAAISYEMAEAGCETPLDVMSDVVTDGSVLEKQIDELSDISVGDIEADPATKGDLTIYYDVGFDAEFIIDWEITCSNVIEGTYIIIPMKLEIEGVCQIPVLPLQGEEKCGHESGGTGTCAPDLVCGVKRDCTPKYCDENGQCTVIKEEFDNINDWNSLKPKEKICNLDGVGKNLCGQYICVMPNSGPLTPYCGEWDDTLEAACDAEATTSYKCRKGECIPDPDGGAHKICDIVPDTEADGSSPSGCHYSCASGNAEYDLTEECSERNACNENREGTCNQNGNCVGTGVSSSYDKCCSADKNYVCQKNDGGGQYSVCKDSDGNGYSFCCSGVGAETCEDLETG